MKATAVSKTLGRNRSYLFSNDSDDFYHSHGCDWNHRIHEAIKHGRLQLYLQPIESISNRQVNHYEALLRMTVAETGEIRDVCLVRHRGHRHQGPHRHQRSIGKVIKSLCN